MHPISSSAAPAAIGAYSQGIRVGNTVYLSGQIPLDPVTQVLCSEHIDLQIKQVIKNIEALCHAAGGTLADIVKITIYVVDLSCFSLINDNIVTHFLEPYPARVVLQVAGLPRGAQIEMDAIMVLR
jgi:reactive intermediate/imine deaminase